MGTAPELTQLAPHAPAGRWRRWFSFPAAMMALLLALVFVRTRYDIADPDIWWHLRDAAYLFAHRGWIHADMYSYTLAGRPWINPEWLSEVPYYLAWRCAGLVGVELCSTALLALIFLGVWYLGWRESGNAKSAVLACVLAALLATVSFGPRTILAGYLLLVALLLLLQRFRLRERAPLWLLPPLFCLWINTHGSWSLGLAVFVLIIAGGLPRRNWGGFAAIPWNPRQARQLLLALVASVAALFANPYGYRLVLYPLDMAFRQKLNISHVAEWVSVDFHTGRGKLVFAILAVMALTALARRARFTIGEVGLGLFGLYAGLTYIRFLFLAGILLAPTMAKLFDFLPPYRSANDKPAWNAALMAAALGFCLIAHPTAARTEATVARAFPTRILPYWQAHPPAGRVLAYYFWSGYLGWRDPNWRDFVDSRVDLFEYAGVFQDYIDLIEMRRPEEVLDQYGIQSVLFPPDEPLSAALRRDPAWRIAYADGVCLFFVRRGPTPVPQPPAAGAPRAVAW